MLKNENGDLTQISFIFFLLLSSFVVVVLTFLCMHFLKNVSAGETKALYSLGGIMILSVTPGTRARREYATIWSVHLPKR